jgi:hypothetical protein
MQEIMTLEQFHEKHSDDIIMLISYDSYVIFNPNKPLDQLTANLGITEMEIPISWNDLKNQVVEKYNYDSVDGVWYLLTSAPEHEYQPQILSM